MAAGRNGEPTPTGGAVRTAERTGKIPVERTGGTRPRQARPRPAGGQGPYDVDDADPRVSHAPGVLDFGALRVPVPSAGQVTVEPSANGRMQAVHVNLPGGRLSVSALAAPKSSKLWPQLAKEIDASLREGGAKVRSFKGEWGRELHATTGAATSVFVGVDGPRWMIYGVATGPSSESPALDAELRRMLSGTVVVRGKSPYPVRTVLPLTTPEELADQVEQAEPASAPLSAPVSAPTPAPPPVSAEPPRRRPPAAEPAWADPVQRIADAPDTEVLPEGDDAAAATGLATSSWPVDERTGRPRAPEWTGEQRVPPRRRKAPPAAEVAAAITEPILITAVTREPAAPPRDTAPRDPQPRNRNRSTEADQPATTRLPVVPDAAPASGRDARPGTGSTGRAESGIDAYFGWDRSARPEPAPDRPAAERPVSERPAPDRPVPDRSGSDRDRRASERPVPDRPVSDRPAAPAPVDPLDPSAPVDTRWLDEPGITTAWEAVTAGLAAEAERSEPARREPERPEPAPEPAAQDWAEWARQELDRAVSGRASAAEAEQASSSFWDRYGLQEPSAGGRASRRHRDGPEEEPAREQRGRSSRADDLDPFTARRRSRAATRGTDPDAPARRRRSAEEADVTELPSRTGRVHHLNESDAHGIGADDVGRSARTIWEDMSATRAPGLHGDDDVAPRSRAGRSNGSAAPEHSDRAGRRLRADGSDTGDRPASGGDLWSGGAHPLGSADRAASTGAAGRGADDATAARSGWADLSRAANAIGRADRAAADRSSAGDWAGLSEGSGAAGSGAAGFGAAGSDTAGSDTAGSRARAAGHPPFETAPQAGWPAESDPSDPRASGRRTQARPHRGGGARSDDPDRALPRRAAAEPPSPWAPAAPDPWSAAPSHGGGAAGWTTGWPGTGSGGRRTDEPARSGYDQAAARPAGGGRRRADDGSARLSVAELAQRAAREATSPRRSRHTRPGSDRDG